MWLYSERKDDVIWSELKLGSQLELNAILFQSWSKIRSNSKLPSIIVTNISRSSPHTTLWFTEVRHQHLKTNLQGLLPRVHILIVSISNLKLPVFGLFCVLSTLWSLKYPHPKSQQTPRVSTKLEMVVNLSYSFISKKYCKKVSIAHLKTRGRALKISKRRRTRQTNFTDACADEMPDFHTILGNYT